LHFGDAPSPKFFQREGFEGTARQVTSRSHAVDQCIRDLECDIDEITLTRPSNEVKRFGQNNNIPSLYAQLPHK
jgi:hypothetical protein